MCGKVTPENVIFFTKTGIRLAACLSPPPNAGKSEIIRYEIYWWFCFILSWSISLPVMYDLYLNTGDIDSVLLNAAELCPLCTSTLKLSVCRYYGRTLQACISKIENFLQTANPREQDILQGYVDRCIKFYYFIIIFVFFTGLGFSSSPLLLPQPYPARTSYPFDDDTELVKNILRGSQVLALCHCSTLVLMDLHIATLIWFAGFQFEIFSDGLRDVSNSAQLCTRIQKHQEILQYSKDVNSVSRIVAYGVAFTTSLGTVTGAVQFLQDISVIVKIRFISFVLVGLVELLSYCWPAENLLETSGAIGYSVYSLRWIDKSPKMKKLIFIVMQRAKKPAIISVGQFLPILSLSFYGSILNRVDEPFLVTLVPFMVITCSVCGYTLYLTKSRTGQQWYKNVLTTSITKTPLSNNQFLSTSFSYFTTLRATTTTGA